MTARIDGMLALKKDEFFQDDDVEEALKC